MEATVWREQEQIIHTEGNWGCDGGSMRHCGSQSTDQSGKVFWKRRRYLSWDLKDDREITQVRREGEKPPDRSHCMCKDPGVRECGQVEKL